MDYRAQFEAYLSMERGLAQGSIETYLEGLSRLERFTDWSFTGEGDHIDAPTMRPFFRETTFSHSTKRSTHSAAKTWEKWGDLEGLFHANGILSLQPPMGPPEEPNPPLHPGQIEAILGAARKFSEVKLVYLGLFCGTRIEESAHMRPEHWNGDRLRFVGKRSRTREVPVHPDLRAVKRVITPDRLGNRGQLQYACERLREKVGFYFRAHQLRDTFAQHLLDRDIALPVVESLLGHVHRSMTLRAYATVPWHQKQEAIAVLDYSG